MRAITTLRAWHWQLAQRLDYHVGEAIRFRWFLNVVVPLITPQTRTVLDAGSGVGHHAFYLARRFPHLQVTGLDNRAEVIAHTAARAREAGLTNLHFVHGDLTRDLPPARYDLIYSIDVLEHIPDDERALAHMAAALRPGGWLAVHSPLTPQTHWFRRFDLDRCVNPLHAREGYRRGELEAKLAALGLSVRRTVYTHGAWGTLAWELWRWSRYRLPRYLPLLPLIRLLVAIETRQTHEDGNCAFVVAQKEPIPSPAGHPSPDRTPPASLPVNLGDT